jgi:hypothetical protein
MVIVAVNIDLKLYRIIEYWHNHLYNRIYSGHNLTFILRFAQL